MTFRPNDHFLLGTSVVNELIVLERCLFAHHCSITGNPGSGKSMNMLSMLKQSILYPDDTKLLVYIDLKGMGDPVTRNWLKQNVTGWRFCYFTPNQNEESENYNPLASIMSRFSTPVARTDALCSKLGIVKGSRETFFPHNNIALCLETLQKHNPRNFTELHRNLEAVRDKSKDRYKHATDIINRVRTLAGCPRLADGLQVADLFTEPTVLCVSLPVMEGSSLPQFLAKFLLSDIVLAANGRKTLIFCDEAQHLFDNRETILVAEQARGCGVGIVMASQSADQYQTEDGKPLKWIVDKLCRVHLDFSPNTPDDLKKNGDERP